uniref:L27 domain-containing protein n=1 Tax=Monodelphis domestica TaxID=13616 RepID=A0A5F8HJH8_MONDO
MLDTIDTSRALQAAERLQVKLRERGDVANEDKLSLLKSVLQSPLFSQILNLQTSVQQLKDQVNVIPSISSTGEELAHFASSGHPTSYNESYLLGQNNGDFESYVGSSTPQINGKPSGDEFDQLIKNMAQGRPIEIFELVKPTSGGLGFSVVGLKSENRGELGIFVQEIQREVWHKGETVLESDMNTWSLVSSHHHLIDLEHHQTCIRDQSQRSFRKKFL